MRRLIVVASLIVMVAATGMTFAQEAPQEATPEATPAAEQTEFPNANSAIPPCNDNDIAIMVPAIIQLNQIYNATVAGSENLSEDNVSDYLTNLISLRDEWRYRVEPQFPDCTLAINHNLLFSLLVDESVLSFALVQTMFHQRALGNEELATTYAQMARSSGSTVGQLGVLYRSFLNEAFPPVSISPGEATPEATAEATPEQ